MVKLIGVFLILSSIIALAAGAFIDLNYASDGITGNVVSNIISQPSVNLGFFDYVEGFAFSYSIISLLMGIVFLFRL